MNCIPSIFNEVRRENILFALPYPYSARPNGSAVFLHVLLFPDRVEDFLQVGLLFQIEPE